MGVRNSTLGASELRLASPIIKRDFTALTTIGGAANQRCGFWMGGWVKVPNPFTGNQLYNIFGADTDRDGLVNQTNQTGLVIGGPSSGTSTLRPRWRNGTNNFGADTISQLGTAGQVYLLLVGATNIGTNTTASWLYWIATVDQSGNVQTMTFANNSSITTSSTQAMLANLFASAGTGLARTPVGFELEHIGYIDGDFPWDTANNPSQGVTGSGRPHHDALLALAGFGSFPYVDFAGLVAGQNAGTLPYPNLRTNGDSPARPGRGQVSYWWKLINTSDLTNYGTAGSNTLTVELFNGASSSGITTSAAFLAPTHWQPVASPPSIIEPTVKFIAGRGALSVIISGTYDQIYTTALERRWVYASGAVNSGATTGVAVPGYDWADITGISGGTWSRSETLPVGGPYTLEVRDKTTTSRLASSTGWMVGTSVLFHGQSGMALSIRSGYPTSIGSGTNGSNMLGKAVASNAIGQVLRLDNMYATTTGAGGTTYQKPAPYISTLTPGSTPAVGQGAVNFLNEWNVHNPRHPLLVVNMSINTHSMDNWASNIAVPDGHTSWKFLGPLTLAAPGNSDGSASGVVNFFAFLLGGYVDAHLIMWAPGMSDVTGSVGDLVGSGSGRAGYRAAIDARFTNATSSPWVVLPVWRVHRTTPDAFVTVSKRESHYQFMAELGTRGILGPQWSDIVMDNDGTAHAGYNTSAGNPDAGSATSDGNEVGQARLGRGFGRVMAWAFNRKVKAHGPRLVGAWFTDGTRTAIALELGRQSRTLNSAALLAGQFWVSTDNGASFVNTGFTAALSSDGTRVILTSTGAAWPATNVRVDVHWTLPFDQSNSETGTELRAYGLLYDNQTHRGNVNLASPAGNPVQGINRSGAGVAGVAVGSRGSARLVATEKFTGTRNITVRLMAADGVTVLREKTLAIAAS